MRRGRPPFGYRREPTAARWDVDEPEAATVRLIFESASRLATQRITQLLNERGCPTRNGGAWLVGDVARLIKNPVYAGTSGDVPALVSRDVWEKAQLRPGNPPTRWNRRREIWSSFARGSPRPQRATAGGPTPGPGRST